MGEEVVGYTASFFFCVFVGLKAKPTFSINIVRGRIGLFSSNTKKNLICRMLML